MESNNLTLWGQVFTTPPEQTKPITGKAYKGTSPKPYWLIQKATETFGPCGIGWGFKIIEEKILDGALIEPGFFERVHMARVQVWYEWQGKRGEVEHVGQTEFSGRRKSGANFTDEDAPKKSVTDALVKALSMIGFAGDIFIGRYDDSKYVAGLHEEARQANRKADDGEQQRKRDQQAAKLQSMREWAQRELVALGDADEDSFSVWQQTTAQGTTLNNGERLAAVRKHLPEMFAEFQALGFEALQEDGR